MFLPLDYLKSRIFRLNRKLNDFEWGIVVSGKSVTDEDKIDWADYRTLSCKDFVKYETGTCWDYTNYEARYFLKNYGDFFDMTLDAVDSRKKADNVFSIYYMEFDDGDGTRSINHTWLAYFMEGCCYLFESSWKPYAGITRYDDEYSMIEDYIRKQVISEEAQGYSAYDPMVYKYKPVPSGKTAWEFISRIRKEGNLIFS